MRLENDECPAIWIDIDMQKVESRYGCLEGIERHTEDLLRQQAAQQGHRYHSTVKSLSQQSRWSAGDGGSPSRLAAL